jgi:site-specific DNA-methyltransferase (adenine-specific)
MKELKNGKVRKNDKIFYNEKDTVIVCDDFLKSKVIKNASIDLTITSPPYNVDLFYDSYKDDLSYEDYLSFSHKWIKKVYQLTKLTGRFCLNIPLDKNKGGQQSVYADLTTIAKKIGWKYHSTVIWNEQNISRRTAWGSWLSASAPYVIAPVEMIVILYKAEWKRNSKGESDINKQEFQEWTNGVWNFNGESKKRIGHPAPYPVELPKRCIKLFSYVGDLILDPFLGSGTTLIASAILQRKGIGFDIDKSYCEIAKRRLEVLYESSRFDNGIFQETSEKSNRTS